MAPKKIAPRFSTQARHELPGSEKAPFAPSSTDKVAPASGKFTVSVVVRRKTPLNVKTLGKVRITRAEYTRHHAADKADLKLVHAFAKEYGLTVEKNTPKPERRTVLLSGTPAAMQKAFGVTLKRVTTDGATYRVREGAIHIPAELTNIVVAVLGLDNRPQAKPHFRIHKRSGIRPNAAATNTSYTPVQVGQLYQFPAGATATGQTIGIIELGGGYKKADLTAYFKTLGQKAPTVTTVSVDKGKNKPDGANGADGEVMLDIEVAGAIAVGAKIVVYFAPNTDQGFIDAIATAVHDTTNKPSVISISWGGPESSWTAQSLSALDAACQSAAALGITITVAAGDNGATDGGTGNNVDFPASSPHVLACGGTKLVGSGSTITSEVVWNETAANEGATGGGVSTVFPLPTWQANSGVPASTTSTGGRGVPDVAGDADPATGYTIRVDGQTMVIGGTSAVAPLWAGLIALSNAQNKTTAGFIQPTIYAAKGKTAFNDITSGNNGAFSAGPGWDACTGLGSPIGTKIIALLGGTTASKKTVKKAVAPKKAARK
ncbi:S53 family peptidase [Granulicella arctica]|uniref:Kumamolisin n=1 Tax=Granulicella arctica TaxID=940613 RepID=A0A7Y9PGG5_9BACT|nr:S53 family peptidase [Granulicella arctica]NYF79397.1 kumamolisin [Granulicella arctica]